jgi:hypothetical protein
MALQKSFENSQGHVGDYWRVDQITMERQGMKLEARLNLYKSKVDRDGGKRRMDVQKILVFDIPAGGTSLNQLVAGIYSQAKTTPTADQAPTEVPFFNDAVDI